MLTRQQLEAAYADLPEVYREECHGGCNVSCDRPARVIAIRYSKRTVPQLLDLVTQNETRSAPGTKWIVSPRSQGWVNDA